MNMAVDVFSNSCILRCFTSYFLANGKSPSCDLDLQILFVVQFVLHVKAEQEQACSNCVIASSQNSNSFLERFDRMYPWRRSRNFKPMELQNFLVGTKAFVKDSLRQCGRLVKAFGTKVVIDDPSAQFFMFLRPTGTQTTHDFDFTGIDVVQSSLSKIIMPIILRTEFEIHISSLALSFSYSM